MSYPPDVQKALDLLILINHENRDAALSDAASRLALAIEWLQWEAEGNTGPLRSSLRIAIRKSDNGPRDPDPAKNFAITAARSDDPVVAREIQTPAFKAVADYEACRAAGSKPLLCMVALAVALGTLLIPFASRR